MESKIRKQIIELYEKIVAGRGFTPLFGKIFAILLLEDEPLDQKRLSKLTNYSISAVSETLSSLINSGLVAISKKKGDRTNYYQIKYSVPELLIKNITRVIMDTKELSREYDELLSVIESKNDPKLMKYKLKIEEIVKTYEFLNKKFDQLLIEVKSEFTHL